MIQGMIQYRGQYSVSMPQACRWYRFTCSFHELKDPATRPLAAVVQHLCFHNITLLLMALQRPSSYELSVLLMTASRKSYCRAQGIDHQLNDLHSHILESGEWLRFGSQSIVRTCIQLRDSCSWLGRDHVFFTQTLLARYSLHPRSMALLGAGETRNSGPCLFCWVGGPESIRTTVPIG